MGRAHTLTVMGLGPGDVRLLTIEALDVLEQLDVLYVRSEQHPVLPPIRERFPSVEIRSFDHLYASSSTFEEVRASIVSEIMDRASTGDLVYGVPGNPMIEEATVDLLLHLARTRNMPVRIVQGVSFVEPVLAAAGHTDKTWLMMVDAVELDSVCSRNALGEVPGRPGLMPDRVAVPTAPLLISHVYDERMAASVKLWLGMSWPEDHEVIVVRGAGTVNEHPERLPIHQLDRISFDHLTAVFVPAIDPVEDVRTFNGLLNVTRVLRAPGGCPWDREQTHDSLKSHLLEETYEVIEALDERDSEKLCGELGDLLFQVTIHSQVAAEAGDFNISDVVAGVTQKLIRRHPHVFSDAHLPTSAAVLEKWETMKQSEMPGRKSVLESIPLATPALPYSYSVQKRAANQGFEWPDVMGVLDKVEEELAELRQAVADDAAHSRILEELGDLFFALVSAGRWLKIDPEEALRKANRKFLERFQYVEQVVNSEGHSLRELSPEELDTLWQKAKGTREPS